MPRRSEQLVVEYLENVSRKALEDYQQLIREYVKGKNGVYALYHGNRLRYVGLATDLRTRLKMHLKDRHAQSWDKFSVFLTIDDKHLREMEALVIRIAKPKENLTQTKFKKAENLAYRFRNDIKLFYKQELDELFGIYEENQHETRTRVARKRSSSQKPQTSLAPFIDPKQPFFKIYAHYKGKNYKAIMLGNGVIKYRGREFYTPSAAGKYIRKKESDGWHFWKYRDPDSGELVPLDNLRKG